MILGRRLCEARVNAGLTQAEVGEALGVNQTWVGKCERGERGVQATDIPLLADLFGTTPAALLGPPTPEEAAERDYAIAVKAAVREAEARGEMVDLEAVRARLPLPSGRKRRTTRRG